MKENTSMIKIIIDNNRDVYEQMVLGCVMKIPSFYFTYRDIIGKFTVDKKSLCTDFISDVDNTFYNILSQYYELLNTALKQQEIDPCKDTWILGFLDSMITNQEKPDGYRMVFPQRIQAVSTVGAETVIKTVEEGLTYWLEQRRSRKLFSEAMATTESVASLVDKVKTMQKDVTLKAKTDTTLRAAFITKDTISNLQHIEGPFSKLNLLTNGGFARGESCAVIAPQGAGKTVFACQHAVHYAYKRNYKTLFISTEQGMIDLFPRMVSCTLGIPFAAISQGIYPEELTKSNPAWMNDINAFTDATLPYLRVMDWPKSGSGLGTQLEVEINKFIEEGFKPDVVILDWIGGGLGDSMRSNYDWVRHYYQSAADKISDLARLFNCFMMYFAQIHVSHRNKKYVDDSMLNECKSMCNTATWGIGISAMYNGTDRTQANYAEEQYLNPFKTRKSESSAIVVKRDFGYQRFVDDQTVMPVFSQKARPYNPNMSHSLKL